MSSVLMNFINSKIAYQLEKPWACDRCHSTKPPPLGMKPPTHTPLLPPAPNLATCKDLRLPRNLQETPSSFRASNLKAAAPTPATSSWPWLPAQFLCPGLSSVQRRPTWPGSWLESTGGSSQRGLLCPSSTSSPTLGRASPRHTYQVESLGLVAFSLWPHVALPGQPAPWDSMIFAARPPPRLVIACSHASQPPMGSIS